MKSTPIFNFFRPTAGTHLLPRKTNEVPDRPAVTLVVLSPDDSLQDDKTAAKLVQTITREYGSSSRTFKSALVFCVAESADVLRDEARKVLAWEDIDEEASDLKLDDIQIRQLSESLKKAHRDLKAAIWRTYKVLMLLGKDNTIKQVDSANNSDGCPCGVMMMSVPISA